MEGPPPTPRLYKHFEDTAYGQSGRDTESKALDNLELHTLRSLLFWTPKTERESASSPPVGIPVLLGTRSRYPRGTIEMARKSQRLSSAATPKSTTHKRVASTTATHDIDAKKAKTKKATPTKSQYFKNGDDAMEKGPGSGSEEFSSAPEDDQSEFGSAAGTDADMNDDEDEDEYEYDSEEAPASRKKPATARGKELWRENSKTGLGPGKEVIIKKPKARPAGKVPYSDETLHPNTLLFLTELKANNNREWLKSEFSCALLRDITCWVGSNEHYVYRCLKHQAFSRLFATHHKWLLPPRLKQTCASKSCVPMTPCMPMLHTILPICCVNP